MEEHLDEVDEIVLKAVALFCASTCMRGGTGTEVLHRAERFLKWLKESDTPREDA